MPFLVLSCASALTAFIGGCLLIVSARKYNFGLDKTVGRQKIHTGLIPRTGGLAVFISVSVWLMGYSLQLPVLEEGLFLRFFLVTMIPVFLGGFFEDITHNVSASSRFLLSMSSAIIGYFILQAVISRVAVEWVDLLLQYKYVSLPLSVLAVSAVCNGFNMIDGCHGNSLSHFLVAMICVGGLTYRIGDLELTIIAVTFLGGAFGVFLLNWPWGKIFIGDAGSYTLGFVLSTLSILLVARSPEVSPWLALALVSYPFFEVVFSFLRRIKAGINPFTPDSDHLHSLLAALLRRNAAPNKQRFSGAIAAVIMLAPYAALLTVAFIYYNASMIIGSSILVYFTVYLVAYFRLKQTVKPKKV